jgi:hypothetical protein
MVQILLELARQWTEWELGAVRKFGLKNWPDERLHVELESGSSL